MAFHSQAESTSRRRPHRGGDSPGRGPSYGATGALRSPVQAQGREGRNGMGAGDWGGRWRGEEVGLE